MLVFVMAKIYSRIIQGIGLALNFLHLTSTFQNKEEYSIVVIKYTYKISNADKNYTQIIVASTPTKCCWSVNWCGFLLLGRKKNHIHTRTINVRKSNQLQVFTTTEFFSLVFVMKQTQTKQIVCFVSFKVVHKILFSLIYFSMLEAMVFLALVI